MSQQIGSQQSDLAARPSTLPQHLVDLGWRLTEDKKNKSFPWRCKNDRLGLYTNPYSVPFEAIRNAQTLQDKYDEEEARGEEMTENIPTALKEQGWRFFKRDSAAPFIGENKRRELSTGGCPNLQEAIDAADALEERAAIEGNGEQDQPFVHVSEGVEEAVEVAIARESDSEVDAQIQSNAHTADVADAIEEQRADLLAGEPDAQSKVTGLDLQLLDIEPGVQDLHVDIIRTDGGTQPRSALDMLVVADYKDAMINGAEFPPVDAFFDGNNIWLADGFHRLQARKEARVAFKNAGFNRISTNVRTGTQRDALLYSLGANAAHGLPRSREDKRRAVIIMLEDPEWTTFSDTIIAEKTNVSQPFVSKVRRELTSQNVLSEQPVRRGKDDVVRDTSRIGVRHEEDDRQSSIENIDGVDVAVRACRKCGCTDEKACEGGCSWVESDLCSNCTGEDSVSTSGEVTSADIVALLTRHGGSLYKMQLEEMGCGYGAILNALAEGAIVQPETGKFTLPDHKPQPTTPEPTSPVEIARESSSTSSAPAKPRLSIEEILKGQMLAVSFVWMKGVRGKVQVTVNATTDKTKASRELIDSDKVRGFDPVIQQMIVEQLSGKKASAPATAPPAKKKLPTKVKARPRKKPVTRPKPSKKAPVKKKAAKGRRR